MITLQGKLPRKLHLAVSGGVDSVAALHFLSRKHEVTAVHVNHDEGNSDESQELVSDLCAKLSCELVVKKITANKAKELSTEEFWRIERYDLFHAIDDTVITAHTLDDCVETWVWSSLHGTGKIIPYENLNVLRPFRLTTKADFVRWATINHLDWVEDNSNADLSLARNYIRHVMMPQITYINPGIATTIKKKVQQDYV